MRIISGIYKGRKINLKLPKGIRPTQDAMRETIFNILNNYVDFNNVIVADICAGTGMLGIEALSRGAKFSYFIDKSRISTEYIKSLINLLNIPNENFQLKNLDALQFLNHIYYSNNNINNPTLIDLFFIDPPYNTNIVNEILSCINYMDVMNENAIIIAETSIHNSLLINNNFEIITERQFGASKVTFIKREK